MDQIYALVELSGSSEFVFSYHKSLAGAKLRVPKNQTEIKIPEYIKKISQKHYVYAAYYTNYFIAEITLDSGYPVARSRLCNLCACTFPLYCSTSSCSSSIFF